MTMGRQSGFSLIEVMCAILILGIALAGMVQGVTIALGSSKEAEVQTTGSLLASGLIEKLRAEGDIADGESDGECGENFPNYQWKQNVTSTTIKGLHDVVVTIENAQTGKQVCELRTMLFEPYLVDETAKANDKKKAEKRKRERSGGQ